MEVAYVRSYGSQSSDQSNIHQKLHLAILGTEVHGQGEAVEKDSCHWHERLHRLRGMNEYISCRSCGVGCGSHCCYYVEVRMKTRNQKARAIQNLTGVIMATAGLVSVKIVASLTWYNVPVLLLGLYLIFTRRLIAGWND